MGTACSESKPLRPSLVAPRHRKKTSVPNLRWVCSWFGHGKDGKNWGSPLAIAIENNPFIVDLPII